jgi:cysteine-rich repeat protein
MKCSRHSGWRLSLFVLLAFAGSAHATISINGRWVVDATVFGTASFEVWTFAQVGTALTQTPPGYGQPGPRTGVIDSTTGAFTVSDLLACHPALGPESCTVSGTVAPDGLTFTGTLSCAAPTPTECGGGEFPLMGWLSPPTCGNGVLDPGEQCDDGTNLPGGCCDPGCRFFASGTPCASGNVCIAADTCDGAGPCVPGPPLACDQCSRCDATAAGCVPAPATTCRAPAVAGASQLTLKTKHSKLSWRWSKGQATTLADLGDPVHADAYALCLYDVSGTVPNTLYRATLPPGAGWRAARRNGFVYKNKVGVADGVTGITLKAGADGKAKIVVGASGPHLMLPALPLPVPLTVQLRGHAECWGASYLQAGVKKNTASEFVAKSSPSGAFLDVSPSRGC